MPAQPAHAPPEDAHLGALLAQARRERGLDRAVLARHLALSPRQVQEIEEGGLGAFYGPAHKALAARKVAAFLGVSLQARGQAEYGPAH